MAGIDFLPGGPGPVPAGKPARNDSGSDATRTTNDSGNSAFGSVLSDSMRPVSRKDNLPSSRDQDESSTSRAPNPPSSAQPPSRSDKPGAKSDPRRSNDNGQTDKVDTGPAPRSGQSTTTTTDNSAKTDSDSTIESEVADVQNNEQQTSADSASGQETVAAPQQGVAPAQLVAGLLIATAQTPTQTTPVTSTAAAPQNGPSQGQAAIANVQKAPPGLAVALEQAATAGDQDAKAPPADDSQPAPAAIHSTEAAAGDAVSTQETSPTPGVQPAVNVSNGVQAPPVVVAKPDVKQSKDTKSQTPDLTDDGGKSTRLTAQTTTATPITQPTQEATPSTGKTTSMAGPVADATTVTAPATDAPTTGGVNAKADSTTRPKEEKGQQAGPAKSVDLGFDAPKDTGIQVELGTQTKVADATSENGNVAATSIASEQTATHAREPDSEPSTDPTGAVTGFAPDNAARRGDGVQVTGPGGSERSVNPSQVVDQVAHGIQLTHQSGERMQIHLRPPELGNLQIDVSMRDGMLSARLEAQTPSTHQLLLDNLPQLKDSLTQQGLQVDRLEVDLSDSMRSETSAGGNSGRSFEQPQQNENLDGVWDPLPTNAAPQRRGQAADTRASTTSRNNGPMLSLDITV